MGAVAEKATTQQPLAANLGWLLAQAAHTLNTELTAALERLFVSPRSYCVLSAAMSGEYTQTEIAQMVGLDKTTMVVTLDELEADGLAKRVPSSEDRRARVVAVTRAGERKVAEAEITYRVVPFPNETMRAEMLATAQRVAVPQAFLNG